MKLRESLSIALFATGAFMAIMSIPSSGAISKVELDREAIAYITENTSDLHFNGFSNQSYNIYNKFSKTGKIINNTEHTLICRIAITIDFNKIVNKNCTLGFRILDQERYAVNDGRNTVYFEITLLPNQSYDFEALLDRNQNSFIYAFFNISAKSIDGTYSIDIVDSPESPQRVTYY